MTKKERSKIGEALASLRKPKNMARSTEMARKAGIASGLARRKK